MPRCNADMKTSWTDYPIGLFAAAAQSTVGGILLSVTAWACGSWVYINSLLDLYKNGLPTKSSLLDSFGEALVSIPFAIALGVISLIGIPFVIIQWTCAYQIVFRDETRLHRCFLIAYCQMFLMYIIESTVSGYGFFDSHAFNCLQGLLILAFAHLICVSVLYLHYRLSQRQ